jgi:hypothetical protein
VIEDNQVVTRRGDARVQARLRLIWRARALPGVSERLTLLFVTPKVSQPSIFRDLRTSVPRLLDRRGHMFSTSSQHVSYI